MAAAGAVITASLVVLVSGACRGPAEVRGEVSRSDSSGVKLIVSGARDTTLPWHFDSLDVLRDSLGEPWRFTDLGTQVVLTDRGGRTYVLTGDSAIVRFGRDGRHERTLGRKGDGSGEFRSPSGIGAHGDTLFASDSGKRVLVRFGPDLEPVTDRPLTGALTNTMRLAFRTGGLWLSRFESVDSVFSEALYADTLGGAALLRVVAPPPVSVRFRCGELRGSRPLFTSGIAMHAQGPRLLANAQPGYALWLFEGPRAVASIRRPLIPSAPSEADVRALYPGGLTFQVGGRRPDCTVPVEELIARQGLATEVPLVHGVVLLPDGTMWALRTPPAVSPAVVDVFGSDGAYLGTVRDQRLPLGLLPNGELLMTRHAATGGLVIARTRVVR